MITCPDKILSDTRCLDGPKRPPVSVIVPVYNVEPYVADCLLSILSNAIATPLELIIIDDGSTDASIKVISTLLAAGNWPETLFLQQENRGLSAVRNLGIKLARGDYIAFLDSDDFILSDGLGRMLHYACEQDCDIVLGRSLIFDSKTQTTTPFYDASLWDFLLAGQPSRTLEAHQYPAVLSLEPNANYRLIKRQFLFDHQLYFPEGLLFEDPPVHFRALLKARRIGLLDMPYYWYRVNRPGKITDEKSRRRFDILKVAALAMTDLKSCAVTAAQGGAALRVLFRLTWGCGTMTQPTDRETFFTQACQLFSSAVPYSWLNSYLLHHRQDIRHLLLGVLLTSQSGSILTAFSFGKRPALPLIWLILHNGYAGTLLCSGWAWLKAIQAKKARQIA